jgi:hypothetical protein
VHSQSPSFGAKSAVLRLGYRSGLLFAWRVSWWEINFPTFAGV